MSPGLNVPRHGRASGSVVLRCSPWGIDREHEFALVQLSPRLFRGARVRDVL